MLYTCSILYPAIERLAESPLKEVIVTDSIALPERKKLDKITVLSVDEIFSEAINRIVNNQSVSELFEKAETKRNVK